VTIRPNFTGTVQNFDGLSRENYEVSRHAELSRILNPVPIFSRFECNVTLTKFIPVGLVSIPISLSSDAFFRAQNASNPFSTGQLPQTPLARPSNWLGRGIRTPISISLPLDAFSVPILVSRSVPISYRRFIVTLVKACMASR